MTNSGVALSAQKVEPWGFVFFSSPWSITFIIPKFSLLAFFISLKWRKKGEESHFGPAADIDPKVIVCHKIIPVRPIGRKYHEFQLKEEGMQRLGLYNRHWNLFISQWKPYIQLGVFCCFVLFLTFLLFPGSRLRQGCFCSLLLVVAIFSSN